MCVCVKCTHILCPYSIFGSCSLCVSDEEVRKQGIILLKHYPGLHQSYIHVYVGKTYQRGNEGAYYEMEMTRVHYGTESMGIHSGMERKETYCTVYIPTLLATQSE